MGRSANSRNRIFSEHDGSVYTEPFDSSKVEDPSLIIYAAIRKLDNKLIVTNGDQTEHNIQCYKKTAAILLKPSRRENLNQTIPILRQESAECLPLKTVTLNMI